MNKLCVQMIYTNYVSERIYFDQNWAAMLSRLNVKEVHFPITPINFCPPGDKL